MAPGAFEARQGLEKKGRKREHTFTRFNFIVTERSKYSNSENGSRPEGLTVSYTRITHAFHMQ